MDALLWIGPQSSERKRMKDHLVQQGFQVTLAELEELGRLEEGKGKFLLAVLDGTALSHLREGIDKVRSRSFGRELPLLLLAREAQLKELRSLQGLEDFAVAPLRPELLEARVRFLLTRLNHLAPGTGKRIGGLELNVDRYEVLLNGEPLELTYKEFELFKFLVTHPGRVFSRDQLLNQVWGYNFIGGTRTVDVHVRRLRAKLGPKHASLVDTVRNVGYKFLERL